MALGRKTSRKSTRRTGVRGLAKPWKLDDDDAMLTLRLPAAAVGELANPVHKGWMHKEGHRRKTFKKRYFVVWPRDFRECGMDAPVLFYFEDDQAERRPKGTVSLANLKCRLPKKSRTIKIPGEKDIGAFCFRVDIDGAPEGHNKFIFATESQKEMIRTRPTHPKLFVDGGCRLTCVVCAWLRSVDGDARVRLLARRRARQAAAGPPRYGRRPPTELGARSDGVRHTDGRHAAGLKARCETAPRGPGGDGGRRGGGQWDVALGGRGRRGKLRSNALHNLLVFSRRRSARLAGRVHALPPCRGVGRHLLLQLGAPPQKKDDLQDNEQRRHEQGLGEVLQERGGAAFVHSVAPAEIVMLFGLARRTAQIEKASLVYNWASQAPRWSQSSVGIDGRRALWWTAHPAATSVAAAPPSANDSGRAIMK